jgi:PPOX class probable F420-dependent enzyme
MLASALGRGNYVQLTSFRKSGQAVATAVWFATSGDKGYFFTGRQTGKAKRLRANPTVQLAPANARGKALGPAVGARARPLAGAEAEAARQLLARKYGLQWTLLRWFARLRGWRDDVFFELTEST